MKALSVFVVAGSLIAATSAIAEYRGGPVTNGASIAGTVRVGGEVKTLPPQAVFKEHGTCGDSVHDDRLVVGKNGELQNAVVYLTNITAGRPIELAQPVKIDNKSCAFAPHVVTASLGQTLELHNSDPFLHDAHAWLGAQTLFNVALPKGRTVRKPLQDVGLIHINCNVRHTWMHAYVLVSEHPYHVVTSADGHFRLDGVPPGDWTVRIWHELLGSKDQQVTVQAGESRTLDSELQSVALGHAAGLQN